MSNDVSKVRKSNERKALTAEIRALRKIEAAIAKARTTIEDNSQSVTGDTFNQIAAVFKQLEIAVTVTDSAVQDKAHKLAQTFVK